MAKFDFNPKKHQKKLLLLIKALKSGQSYHMAVRLYPKTASSLFTKAEVISGLRYFNYPIDILAKPIRTLSGVVPVTLLTKPYPCPGKCIFCPNDVRMPKSYLSAEPGAQRAAQNHFDPFHQVISRLNTYYANGHSTDKVELIILGGTWSAYPLPYQIWFIKRCFEALNLFTPGRTVKLSEPVFDGQADWPDLFEAQTKNQTAHTRCVGLSLETRPDFINSKELIKFRRFGCTKVQIGLQSLNDQILQANHRGHSVKTSQQAVKLLRSFGFKIQAHWMANLYMSTINKDISDFKKLFSDFHYRPDELKIYPTALLATAPLMAYFQKNLWRPYTHKQLLRLLTTILPCIPSYCRVSRIIRDFSSDDIVSGNKTSNFRQLVDLEIEKKGLKPQEIRSREIRRQKVDLSCLKLKIITYKTSVGTEKFIQYITEDNSIVAFLRLSLPKFKPLIKELADSALIRELHVYGQALNIGDQAKTQHLGLGKRLITKACQLAGKAGFARISVISSIGTKAYYRHLKFNDNRLYQHLKVD